METTKTARDIIGNTLGEYSEKLITQAFELTGNMHQTLKPNLECLSAYALKSSYFDIKTRGVLYNVTPKSTGIPSKNCYGCDIVVTYPSGRKVGYEIDGGIHCSKLVKTKKANNALFDNIISRLESKKDALSLSELYVVFHDNKDAVYGGEKNFNKIVNKLKEKGITAIDLTDYDDTYLSMKLGSAERTFIAVEKARQFIQYFLNLTLTKRDSGYYKLSPLTVARYYIDKYQYTHPNINVREVILNAPITSEQAFRKHLRDNGIPAPLGYLALGPRKTQKLQERSNKFNRKGVGVISFVDKNNNELYRIAAMRAKNSVVKCY